MSEIPNFNAEQHALAVSKPGTIREPLSLEPGGRFMVVDFPPSNSAYTGESASALAKKMDGTMPVNAAETASIARKILNAVFKKHTDTVNGIKRSAGSEAVLRSPDLISPTSFEGRSKKHFSRGKVAPQIIANLSEVAKTAQEGLLVAQAHAIREAEEAKALGLTVDQYREQKIQSVRTDLGLPDNLPNYTK